MLALMELTPIKRIVEAALLAAGQPLSLAQLGALFGESEALGADALAQALAELGAECAGRGIELVEVASGFRYQVRLDVHPWVQRLWTERQTRYSRALLETLALIAYRQPVTRPELEDVRGVDSGAVLKALLDRRLIKIVGKKEEVGRPILYGTTRQFLDHFGLASLTELPSLAELRPV